MSASTTSNNPSSTSSTAPQKAVVLSGSMNWDPVRKRLSSTDFNEAFKAASELRQNIEIVHTTEFPLLLSALLPAFSSVLTHRTRPTPDTTSIEHKLRHVILDIINKMPSNEVLRPHAPHLVALAMDVLNRDYEDNALLASKIIFDLYKAYRSLPQDYVQPYLDFVVGTYRSLPAAIQRNFSFPTSLPPPAATLSSPPQSQVTTTRTTEPGTTTTTTATTTTQTSSTATAQAEKAPEADMQAESDKVEGQKEQSTTETTSPESAQGSSSVSSGPSTPPLVLALRSNLSFRVLTESPLIVMLMLQLYPSFLKTNIPVLINVMMEALSHRAPSLQSVLTPALLQSDDGPFLQRLLRTRSRELVAAQAKTLSFVTYLLRSFATELKPYEDRLASSVVALMSICPRESISTRKELLVATRHVLNSDFRKGFYRHVDSMLDERVLIGTHHRLSDQSMLRPLGYTTLSDLVQHARPILTMSQVSKVVLIFSRVLHDSSMTLPMSTQYTGVRTLLSLVDLIFQNKDPNPQLGRDLLVRMFRTLVEKLHALVDYFPTVLEQEKDRVLADRDGPRARTQNFHDGAMLVSTLSGAPPDSVRDVQIMIRAIIVGSKTIISYINGYRNQRDRAEQATKVPPSAGTNDEVHSAMSRLTNTECAIIDRYILTVFPAAKLLKEKGPASANPPSGGARGTADKSLSEQHRDSLTYFAAAFAALDGVNLSKTLGKRLDVLIEAMVDDPLVIVVPRHLLGANATVSFEFCTLLLGHLVERMDELAVCRSKQIIFFDPPRDHDSSQRKSIEATVEKLLGDLDQKEDRRKQKSTVLLQLFERILKSLSVFADNESIVRRHLRRIVTVCLRSSLEENDAWPDNYCMLLRYLFRSISAGKFEESYKELLPLIPTVLNGLYRVISCSRDLILRCTAVELCLTIPARLSSLLPHMNLLLRVIIPALDSKSGDLVNLGLRTLEFWVDNLNPLFLIPEISKHTELFTTLMQALSSHLRPAPYPYGLLTLRLLGKLGGENRKFLREPLLLTDASPSTRSCNGAEIQCVWNSTIASLDSIRKDFSVPLPLDRCVEILRLIATSKTPCTEIVEPVGDTNTKVTIKWDENSRLWNERIETIDMVEYQKDVMEQTKTTQAAACVEVLNAAARLQGCRVTQSEPNELAKLVSLGMMYAGMLDCYELDFVPALRDVVSRGGHEELRESLVEFMHESSPRAFKVGREVMLMLIEATKQNTINSSLLANLMSELCRAIASTDWGDRDSLMGAVCFLLESMGPEWGHKFEVELLTTAFVSVKSVPLELSNAGAQALEFFISVCIYLYGNPWSTELSKRAVVWDALECIDDDQSPSDVRKHQGASNLRCPSDEIFRLAIAEAAAPQDSVRFAARLLLVNFILAASTIGKCTAFVSEQPQMTLVRKLLFSRSLRLLPLPQQVGVIEGLAILVSTLPRILSLSDQHLLAFLSELLKMSSVADGEMSDAALKDIVIDKNGFAGAATDSSFARSTSLTLTHSSALFHRRMSVINFEGATVIVPEQLPLGVQLRVSTITLLDTIIRSYPDPFFDAEQATPIGNVRPHIISLLFRSLVSVPVRAVAAAHIALKNALSLSVGSNVEGESGDSRSHKRLPKELLQACIRPVLLNLRDYTRLSIPLLRGLQRLLELLSSWFNRTLGQKLLDHLQRWLDPSKITALKIWKEGEECYVAAAIVDIFSLLPNSTQFVEPIIKTCMKLEACLPAYSIRIAESPFRQPLARFLDRHPQYAVRFFFQRLKAPVYSELFQSLIRMNDSNSIRSYLSSTQCSVMILNYCFEKPLAIIRSEKSATTGSAPARPLHVYGIGPKAAGVPAESSMDSSTPKPMTEESLELQLQGFRLVESLLESNSLYFNDHNDLVRAFRWLWRSKGRFLRLQHEDLVYPRFLGESSMLAKFLMHYGKTLPNDDFDILFELIRVFLQPSSTDFVFVSQFLREMASEVLTPSQKQQVVNRFFSLISGESSEETKVLSIQYLIHPMLSAHMQSRAMPTSVSQDDVGSVESPMLISESLVKRFVSEVLLPHDSSINCGERLKVELLKLCSIILSSAVNEAKPFQNQMIKFCWSLLKSEDTSCKGWAYVVICRCIAAFETPEKVVRQVYAGLLRLHQPEGKELVREALDLLIPALPLRLNEDGFGSFVDQATKLMFEDSNSTPQLAHISQLIVRNPVVFYPHRSRFSGYLLSSLNRLGLPPNSPLENRVLSVHIVELLLDWDSHILTDSTRLSTSQIDAIGNFLVRLKLLLAEPSDNRSSRLDTGAVGLDARITMVFRRVLSSCDCALKEQPFEKAIAKDRETPGLLLSCLELLVVVAEHDRRGFFARNETVFSDIVSQCFRLAKDDQRLKDELRAFVTVADASNPLIASFFNSLEKALADATVEIKRAGTQRNTDAASRQGRHRDRTPSSDWATEWAEYSLDLLCDLFGRHEKGRRSIESSLIVLATALTKNHLQETSSKQKHGQAISPKVTASGVKSHTPTVGIMDAACSFDPGDATRPPQLRQRWQREEPELTPSLRTLLKILNSFESSAISFHFTQNRKMFFQVLTSLLDSSDSLHIQIGALRVVCKLLISDGCGSPLTAKERSGFLCRLASFDSTNLNDDVSAQALADLVSLFSTRYIGSGTSSSDTHGSVDESVAATCLMNAHGLTRDSCVRQFFERSRMMDPVVCDPVARIMALLQTELDGLGGRFWVAVLVEAMLHSVSSADGQDCVKALCQLAHGDIVTCLRIFELLLPVLWESQMRDDSRLSFASCVEGMLAKPYHAQFLRSDSSILWPRHASNSIRTVLNAISLLNPIPLLDTHLLVYLGENYNSWHEVSLLLSRQLVAFSASKSHGESREETLAALRHCYKQLSENQICLSLASSSCSLPLTTRAISLDVYSMINDAADTYMKLMMNAGSQSVEPTEFEMDLWEDRWVRLQKELCQHEVVNEFANASSDPSLMLECAWKAQDWVKVRSVLSTSVMLPAIERGDPSIKMCETLLAVVEGKVSEIENLHAQTAQLCLYKWQLLPRISGGSPSHAKLLQFFHRLVEIRESGQIMVETSSRSAGRTLPDLKNLLNAWRHRLPNDWDLLSSWDEVFSWRGHMFNAITSNFQSVCEPNVLASLHDRPWTAIRMAKTARKQGFRDVSLLLLNKAVEERSMNVSDAFFKLREQVLTYFNPDSETERHVGLNLIHATNLSFFDSAQKSELFRLKATFLASLGSRSKANQAYCHSLQICQTNAKAWESWGALCSSLGAVAEKQLEQPPTASDDGANDQRVISKKVAQYLAQAMGCYLEAVQNDSSEWTRIHLTKVLWMLTKDGPSPGMLCQTLENRGSQLPGWVWLPWLPQLLSGLCRPEGRATKTVLSGLAKSYAQAVYYSLRVFYLERRDVERSRAGGHHMNSLVYVEELVSLLRRSHASLWSSLESVLEELLVKFRPLHEEELLSPMVALLERAESQLGTFVKKDDEESVASNIWKTIWKIASKFFRPSDQASNRNDERSKKTAHFKQKYRADFESDFQVSASSGPGSPAEEGKSPLTLDEFVTKLRVWKQKLEKNANPRSVSLLECSPILAGFAVSDAPDLWPGSCDPKTLAIQRNDINKQSEMDTSTSQSSPSLSAVSATNAALSAAKAVASAAAREGSGGDYGGGTSFIEIPGQYLPNTAQWADCRPSPELHPKLLRFEQSVHIIRRSDQLVRRIGMVGSDGKTYKFIVQAAVPYMTRTDERTAQVSRVLDMLMRRSVRSARAYLSIQPQSVTPMAQRLRLVSEPEGRLSLEDVYRERCLIKGTDPSDLPSKFNDEVAKAVNTIDLPDDTPTAEIKNREREVRLAVFDRISAIAVDDSALLLQDLTRTMETAEITFQFRRVFAQQWAANCLMQLGLCVAERTPSRVVLVKSNASALSPEFRISYNTQGYIEPQIIPFRLTSNLLNLIGFPLLSGHFVPSMAFIAGSIREHKLDLVPMLRLLARDDLIAFYTRSMPKSDVKTQEMEKQLADRVVKNAATILSRMGECAPRYSRDQEGSCPIDQKIRDLIEAAQSPSNVCQTPSSYQGWL